MNLKSFGCSFIFGTDLPDDGREGKYATPSKLTWSSLLANHYGYGYHCYARPGSGNVQIMERALSQIACNEYALYVIGWSYVDRFDYMSATSTEWKTILPIERNELASTYYRNLHSEFKDKLTTLVSIKVVIDTLKQKGYPFIMTYMDDLMFDDQWNSSPAITDIQNYIKPYMTTFEGSNFVRWSKEKGYPISDTYHPLEEAHRSAADYILSLNLV